MNRINQYLLTHYPLLWNTRVVWVLLANFVLHILFFLSGLAAVSATTLKNYSRIERVGGQGMYTMAALCALVVIIVWCIYYLRNNAFKSFYRIDKWYLAKEYAIIFIIILTSLCYSVSFEYGVKVRVRAITDKNEMVQEINAVNQAMVYVPMDKEEYFILQTCEEQEKRTILQNQMLTSGDASYSYDVVDSTRYKEALQKPDAYSYLHYCRSFIYYPDYKIDSAEVISNRNKQWLNAQQQQQVKQSVIRLTTILNKYAIAYSLNTDELTNAVFANQYYNVGPIIPQSEYSYEYGTQTRNKYFLETNDLTGVYSFIDDCQPTVKNFADYKITWNIIGYLSLGLSILLLCYRRFSKRVFLISVVGTLVWAILVGLMSVGSNSAVAFLTILLMLFVIFLGVALVSLKNKGSKTAAGITLNWQAYLSPFVVMLIVGLINDYHTKVSYGYNYSRSNEWLAEHYPFSTWVVNHTQEIFLVNIILVALYTAFVFNHWAKKWQLLPEE